MKVLFDTNVLISAFLTRGQTFDIIKDAFYKHEVYYTDYVLGEFEKTLAKKFFQLSNKSKDLAVFVLKKYLTQGVSASKTEAICRDPHDDQVLADAVANHIDVIVTGDKDLLDLKKHKRIRIISPNEYWNL